MIVWLLQIIFGIQLLSTKQLHKFYEWILELKTFIVKKFEYFLLKFQVASTMARNQAIMRLLS